MDPKRRTRKSAWRRRVRVDEEEACVDSMYRISTVTNYGMNGMFLFYPQAAVQVVLLSPERLHWAQLREHTEYFLSAQY